MKNITGDAPKIFEAYISTETEVRDIKWAHVDHL